MTPGDVVGVTVCALALAAVVGGIIDGLRLK